MPEGRATLPAERAGRAVALPLLACGAGLAALNAFAAPPDAAIALTIWASTLLGTGLAVWVLCGSPARAPAWVARHPVIGLAAVLLAMTGLIHHLGMQQFGGYDMSLVVDFGWRQWLGQRFPADFPNTTPPSFLLGTLWAVQWGGVRWASFVDVFALFAAVVLAWSWALWRALLGRPWVALGLSTSLGLMALLPLSSWWYNPITSAAAVIFAVSSALVLRQPARWVAWASWTAATALLASAKPNVAGLLLVPVGLILLTAPGCRRRSVLAAAVALLGLEGLLRAYGMSTVDFINGYRGVAARGVVPGASFIYASPFHIGLSLLGLALMLAPLLALVPATRRAGGDRRLAALGAVTVAGGVLAFITSGEVKLVDFVIVHAGLVIWAVAVLPASAGRAGGAGVLLVRYLAALAVLGSCLGVGVGWCRQRVQSIGPGSFHEHVTVREPFAEGFFQGLTAGPRLHATHAEVARALAGVPSGAVFFGPRMQWAYAAFGRPSPVGQAVWLQPGFAFAPSQMPVYIDDVLSGRFDLLVFLHDDYTFFPDDFATRLARDYEPVRAYQAIDVYRKRR